MKIERRFTTEETGAYGALALPHHDLGDPQPRRVGGVQPREPRGAGGLEPGRLRRAGAEVLPQGRRAGGAEAGAREGRAGVPVALGRRRGEARRAARGRAHRRRDQRARRSSTGWPAPGPTGAGRAATSPPRPTRAPTTTRCATCWRRRWARRTRPQWFNTGLHWAYGIDGPGQGHFYVDFQSGELVKSTSAYEHPQPHACFIQSVERRPRQRRRDHGPLDPRGAALQVRLGHRHQLLLAARRERAAGRRRQVVGADELPQDRRPGGGRDQVGRHHAPRGQDGDLRHGSPRHRGLHQLEGRRGAEGRGARRRLQGPPRAARRRSSPRSAPGTAPRPTPSTPRPTPA